MKLVKFVIESEKKNEVLRKSESSFFLNSVTKMDLNVF